MSKLVSSILSVAEKFIDPALNLGTLDLLGISVPDSFSGVGVVGALTATNNVSKYIQNMQFQRDFTTFTNELTLITDEQKTAFYQKYSEHGVKDFGDQAILLLSKIEMPLAAKLMGRAHYLLVQDEINEDTYYNYCYIIKSINLYLFKEINKIFTSDDALFRSGVANNLYNFALLEEHYVNQFPAGAVFQGYKKSEFGSVFYANIIDPFVD